MSTGAVVQKAESLLPYALLREYDDFGLRAVDIVAPPRRFWSDRPTNEGAVEVGVQVSRVHRPASPATLLAALPEGDNWQSLSRRSVTRLQAHFLICEDPQRRMESREVETVAHQISLVRHILDNDSLRRVLIADEVGLGKTVEAGLLVQELLEQQPDLRVLYLTPARLVQNVASEFSRLKLSFRTWCSQGSDGRLTDNMLIASVQRAVHKENFEKVARSKPWDVIIVDECHHLSAWGRDGGHAGEAYKLVRKLIAQQPSNGRVILMSGTPHQGHPCRFENLLNLLRHRDEESAVLRGRVIYRTKDDIRDWDGNPVFPRRQVNEPLILNLGTHHRVWLDAIHDFYKPSATSTDDPRVSRNWRCAQAMQWATSSPQAGLGYLTRQAIRAGWNISEPVMREALAELRPYRWGAMDEPVDALYARISAEVNRQTADGDVADIEEEDHHNDAVDAVSAAGLRNLMSRGIALVRNAGDDKWQTIWRKILEPAGDEKVVLFAQPIETVTALCGFLHRVTGQSPAIIAGGQSDLQRQEQVAKFCRPDGPRFLVSSRAGGEGINLQVSRRLIHIDVPWNPMELEQRVGRVHRFGSRQTVIVDTVVVKDSRESYAFQVAREKLKRITRTMVEAERFEDIFSRVMCLVSQNDLQEVMVNGSTAPFSNSDEERLADVVHAGYQRWAAFHKQFEDQQQSIRNQNPGLLNWNDVASFYVRHGNAALIDGFLWSTAGQQSAPVMRFSDGSPFLLDDRSSAPVYALNGVAIPRFGLNRPEAAEILRNAAFPAQPAGAALLRWSGDGPAGTFGTLVFLKQAVKRDVNGSWTEVGCSLHAYVVTENECQEQRGDQRGALLRGIFEANIRKNCDFKHNVLAATLREKELMLCHELSQLPESQRNSNIRNAITPLFAAIVAR